MRSYFSKMEIILWMSSAFLITAAFFVFDRESYLTLAASLIGVTSLVFNAKGNPFGQFLMVLFSLLYCVFSERYIRLRQLAEDEGEANGPPTLLIFVRGYFR